MGLERIKTGRRPHLARPGNGFRNKKASELTGSEREKLLMQIAERMGYIKENDL